MEQQIINKIILDACCGGKMMWFDRNNPNVLFADIRNEKHILKDRDKERVFIVAPDVLMDFRNMPFGRGLFKLVVFDPPHFKKLGETAYLRKKYGALEKDGWQLYIKQGFDECMRVLEDYGILIFKWNQHQINVNEVLQVIGKEPLFGHTTKRAGDTFWFCFMKIPE